MTTKVLPELKYTKDHEWIKIDADGFGLMGITDHAQHAMGDLVYIELPDVDREVKAHEAAVIAESVKGANDVFAPVSGTVVEVNSELEDAPEKVNADPYGSWMVKLKPADLKELDSLLDAAAYQALVEKEEAEA
ncbi:MAG: glycine cleavage system protein GcvH [Pyramidobacter sp.]|uniref:glycine cleavage system protein GcvH n=1 Tax=unclassified Pyramidobacter TaxID=2632171 RepID=UPI00098F8602|nr:MULTISPECIES: glycine cleavage system protein GcvH [unclassified Pyramidobacter]MDY4032032.1 glycine cleavage system protein GcvH [Pyramidobacter sp.]OON89381.1 glycine cleavage system protein H [Pyramidobacter sp. C12-8]